MSDDRTMRVSVIPGFCSARDLGVWSTSGLPPQPLYFGDLSNPIIDQLFPWASYEIGNC